MTLPAGVRRLFPHYLEDGEEDDLDPRRASGFLISRLLEDGDAADLSWLRQTFGEAEMAAWLERHGGRQLSVRSRAFWEVVLGRQAGGAEQVDSTTRNALWPL
ncbi:MAG TPA: hypothetical protein VHN15_04540 [Thermoanaerobaculia bacterium]|nr:hypothetical protein [Thermoanaerobaculia bacterium]